MMIYQFINFFCCFLILVHSEKKKLVKNIVIKDKKKQKKKEKENSKQSKTCSRKFSPYSHLILYKNSFEIVSGAIRELILNNTKQYERIQSNQ